jgi:hypothetical protein
MRRTKGLRAPDEKPYLQENLELARQTGRDPRLTSEIEHLVRSIEKRAAAWKLIEGTFVEPVAKFASRALKRVRKARG